MISFEVILMFVNSVRLSKIIAAQRSFLLVDFGLMVRLVDESHFDHCLWTQNGTVEMRKRFDDVYFVKRIVDFRDL